MHFGWIYGYGAERIEPGPPIPQFLSPLRDRGAVLASVAPADLTEVLVTEYARGLVSGGIAMRRSSAR